MCHLGSAPHRTYDWLHVTGGPELRAAGERVKIARLSTHRRMMGGGGGVGVRASCCAWRGHPCLDARARAHTHKCTLEGQWNTSGHRGGWGRAAGVGGEPTHPLPDWSRLHHMRLHVTGEHGPKRCANMHTHVRVCTLGFEATVGFPLDSTRPRTRAQQHRK